MASERKEKVQVQYRDKENKIVVKGDSFTITLDITSDQLSTVYWGNIGKGTATVKLEDEPKA